MSPRQPSKTQIVSLSREEFAGTFGAPDVNGAICGYTRADDTRAVLTLLVHARPKRVLEIGTALGHMTANFTRWTSDDAQVFTIDLVRGMNRARPGAFEQEVEVPWHSEWGRFANEFGTAYKAFFITADTMTYDLGRLAPLEFVFVDGAHDFEHVVNDSRKAYEALAVGGWLVWHDFGSTVPWVKAREAVESIGFEEAVVHVEGTEVAFLRKGTEHRGFRTPGPVSVPNLDPNPDLDLDPDLDPDPDLGPDPLPCRDSAREDRCVIEDSTHPTSMQQQNDRIGILSQIRVVWEGDFTGVNSLALVNRAICGLLVERGLNVELVENGATETVGPHQPSPALRAPSPGERGHAGGPFVHVRHRWPPDMRPPAEGRWVLMQPWEYGSLPKKWLPMLERVDEVWAYSRYIRDCYLEAGVPAEKVHVIPLGIDPAVFQPGVERLTLPQGPRMRFLFVGGTIFRKGIDILLTAFERAFKAGDDVGLVIKDMGALSFYRGQTAGKQVAELRERGYAIEYIDRELTEAELAGVYAACDCLVHPFRGEGFALPVVEAMACGLPVIVTGAGPSLDYASDETAFLLPARRGEFAECRVGESETIGRPWLFEPDVDCLVELLRRVAADPAAARAKGAGASAWVRERFTWERTAEAVERRLLALMDQIQHPPRMNTDLHGCGPGMAGAKDHATTHQIPLPGTRSDPCSIGVPSVAKSCGTFKAKISLTMIVRNEEKNLGSALASVAGLFDEIVVVDTGSTDRTPEIAREFGARLSDFVWVDDFAAARNAALARAKGNYAFWLDADDVMDQPQRERLQELLAGLNRHEQAAYVIRCSCDPDHNGNGGQTVVDHIRLFPLREDIRWTYRVHEQILPALRRTNIPVRWTDITVRHTGYTDPELRERKLQRDSKILMEELAERPDDPFVSFNLGSIAVERHDWRRALGHLRQSLSRSAPTDSITRKLFALIARCHQVLGDLNGALAVCSEGLSLDPNDAELLFRKAVVHRSAGQPAEAESCWRKILTLKRPEQFCSVDQGIYGHLTLRNLAVLAEQRGDRAGASGLWRSVLEESPGDSEAIAHSQRLDRA
jgi:glycosyltransferase involved in cell wall biosynthesis/tetratricopeptide (TPR) repeat protein